jgi:hypothetical protein
MYHSSLKRGVAIGLVSLLYPSVWAQSIQADVWNMPVGTLPDLSQSFRNGDILPVSWNQQGLTSYLDTQNNLVDLWVTAASVSQTFSIEQLLIETSNSGRKRR